MQPRSHKLQAPTGPARAGWFAAVLAVSLCLPVPGALAQANNLTHRYSFNSDASDSVGGANGTLHGGAVATNGALVLNGAGSYVSLPANLVTGYTAITIEAWVTDNGSAAWARIFDFGNNTSDYMFLSLPSGSGNLRGACTTSGNGGEQLLQWSGGRPAVGQQAAIAWTSDAATHTGMLYVNGLLVAVNTNLTLTPASLGPTTNNWLGRSQYGNDPYFNGSIHEFRIYNVALSSNAIYQDYLAELPPPVAAQASVQGVDVVITFNAKVGLWYWVQCEDELNPFEWYNLGPAPVLATNISMSVIHAGGAATTQHFYRVTQLPAPPPASNLAQAAVPATSYVSPWETLSAINDGYNPANSADHSHGAYGNWNSTSTNWVEYDWSQPISTSKMDVYWWADGAGIAAPTSCSLQYWNGTSFVPISNPVGLGVALNQYNTTTFDPVTTTRLRLYIVPSGATSGGISTGILQWKVYDNGATANFPPVASAGVDRDVILGGNTYLSGSVQDDGKIFVRPVVTWRQLSGPGPITLPGRGVLTSQASFSALGNYVVGLSAWDGQYTNTSTLNVTVVAPPPSGHLLPVYPSTYQINSPLWSYRLRNTLIHWIPHLYAQLNNTNLAQGNINSFIQAGNRLAGLGYTVPSADPYADAYTLNTVEAMCYALLYDPQGDPAIIAAQAAFRTNCDYWIPIILRAQLPDGYLHTYTTLRGIPHWSNNTLHEGYVAGYFIEAGLAHYLANNRTNSTLYNAAKKLADSWVNNIGPGKTVPIWFDGHENMEQALVHLGRFMDDDQGPGAGQKYVALAKYLMDCRGTAAANAVENDGSTYDQSQAPVAHQYEVVGHAVRAEYLYSGMEDVAMETWDVDYQSAALSLCDNFVNRKYYLTGGAGSGETSEGFGNNWSLPNASYCETCAGCGTLFFFHKMNLAYQDAKYADLMENVFYNEVLGSLDDQANNIFYPNPLNSSAARVSWTGVPCCYGNAARTLFQMPSWIYARGSNSIYVNLFIGSTISIPKVAGTTVQLVQATAYPWSNSVALVVNPAQPASFTLYLREPNRTFSSLYTPTPSVSGLTSIYLNGSPISAPITNGYAVLQRTWTAGDQVAWVLPMVIQRVTAGSKIAADGGLVALQYGPLIYNIESADQDITQTLGSSTPLSAQWNGSLLGGLVQITGTFNNGSHLVAIPNYARLNRGGTTAVWFKGQ
jgi:DUF1680 family protein